MRPASAVAPRVNRGRWELHATPDGARTHASCYARIHPGGVIPGWLVSIGMRIALPEIVAAVRRRVEGRG